MINSFAPHVINLIICAAIVYGCICRLRSEVCTRDKAVRGKYALLIGGAFASGLEPIIFSPYSDMGNIFFGMTILAGLCIDAGRWYMKGKCNDTCFL